MKRKLLWPSLATVLVVVASLLLVVSSFWASNNEREIGNIVIMDQSRRFLKNDWEGKIVVFLDMDGVLAPYPEESRDATKQEIAAGREHCHNKIGNANLAAFSELLTTLSLAETKIVFASAWRQFETCTEHILDKFHEYGLKHGGPLKDIQQFDDRTGEYHESRQNEIAMWLLDHDDDGIAAWIVLDDRESILEEEEFLPLFTERTVITEEKVGLTSNDVENAVKLLLKQLIDAQIQA